jgi:hypothetical protein
MRPTILTRTVSAALVVVAACKEDPYPDDPEASAPDASLDGATANRLSFFVSSADARCQRLADAAGAGSRIWRAYLSAEAGPVHARDRIGEGPWYNAQGALLAEDVAALHALTGNPELFLDEHGEKINGQWEGSPTPNQHDILTGSDAEGRLLAGKTCADWTSASAMLTAQVGHSDGLGPNRNGAPPFNSWQSSHESAGCNDTAPRGGAGRIYCFAAE